MIFNQKVTLSLLNQGFYLQSSKIKTLEGQIHRFLTRFQSDFVTVFLNSIVQKRREAQNGGFSPKYLNSKLSILKWVSKESKITYFFAKFFLITSKLHFEFQYRREIAANKKVTALAASEQIPPRQT